MSLLARGLRRRQSGGVIAVADVFATSLYTGNGSTQTITNGIDLAGEGGMVWIKNRIITVEHIITSSGLEGVGGLWNIRPNETIAAYRNFWDGGFLFNSDGLIVTKEGEYSTSTNKTGDSYVSWTFRRAPRFFDVVTYTGNNSTRSIAHNLTVIPGIIIIKCISAVSDWWVIHKDISVSGPLKLNTAESQSSEGNLFRVLDSSTTFTIGPDSKVNTNNATYIAYLFAHDPDGVIQCGSYTGNAAVEGPIITLGWEPQYLLIKNISSTYNWQIIDTARGWPIGSDQSRLYPNKSDAEVTNTNWCLRLSNGFQLINGGYPEANSAGDSYIYLAIKKAD